MAAAAKDLRAEIAVTRFGLGSRPGEIAEVRADPTGWLLEQVVRRGGDQPQSVQQQAARTSTVDVPRDAIVDEMLARVRLGASTPAGFRERWTLFWANHFTVAAKSPAVAAGVGPFERQVIRPIAFGRFEDMLMAATRHPGMLLYLDQVRSAGPNSRAAAAGGQGGLNEVLAGAILELHTIGAGYGAADVSELARALTGWSMNEGQPRVRAGDFVYRSAMHEPGPRTVMGRRYPAEGEEQARRILADLASDPRTARRLSRKIAAHFVADDPPAALVARIEQAWLKSSGDFAAVAGALIEAPEAWESHAAKLKTPYEFLVSSYRAIGLPPADGLKDVAAPLTTLGQRPFGAPQPAGWSDLGRDWATPDALVKRMAWAQAFARAYAPAGPSAEAAEAVLGGRLSARTRRALTQVRSRPEGFAILLMSPEFQRR